MLSKFLRTQLRNIRLKRGIIKMNERTFSKDILLRTRTIEDRRNKHLRRRRGRKC